MELYIVLFASSDIDIPEDDISTLDLFGLPILAVSPYSATDTPLL